MDYENIFHSWLDFKCSLWYGESMIGNEQTQNELTLCLEKSLSLKEGSFVREMKEDFRRLEARFKCTAKGVEEERCVRFVYHAMGCTYRTEQGTCEAPQS
jgi:hypothetical protein